MANSDSRLSYEKAIRASYSDKAAHERFITSERSLAPAGTQRIPNLYTHLFCNALFCLAFLKENDLSVLSVYAVFY